MVMWNAEAWPLPGVTVNRNGLKVRNPPPTSMPNVLLPLGPLNTTRQFVLPFTSVKPVPGAQATEGPLGLSGIRRMEIFGTCCRPALWIPYTLTRTGMIPTEPAAPERTSPRFGERTSAWTNTSPLAGSAPEVVTRMVTLLLELEAVMV